MKTKNLIVGICSPYGEKLIFDKLETEHQYRIRRLTQPYFEIIYQVCMFKERPEIEMT